MDLSTEDSRVRIARTTADPDVLRSLMSDESAKVRKICAQRITDVEDLKALASHDPNGAVAWFAQSQLNLQTPAWTA